MQVTAQHWATLGNIIAILMLLLAVLGLLGVLPFTATVVFGILVGLAIARIV